MNSSEQDKQPLPVISSRQLQLFRTFFGPSETLSNTIDLWDAIPKYAVSLRRQAELRDASGRLPVYRQPFSYAHKVFELAIQPAAVGGPLAPDVDYFPSADDELVEDVLRKLFVDQHRSSHDPERLASWVSFTLQQVSRELMARGHTRSLDEIKHSLAVLSRTQLMVYGNGRKAPIYETSILIELVRIERKEYLDDPGAMWRVRFPLLLSESINEQKYRQLNYGVLMALPSQLSRWLHKRLSHNYTNASMVCPYTILLSTVARDSGLLGNQRKTRAASAVARAFDALVAHGVLSRWTAEPQRVGPNEPLDLKYTLYPDLQFIAEMKAANARARQLRDGRAPSSD